MSEKIALYIADLRDILTNNKKRSEITNRTKELFLPQILKKQFSLEEDKFEIINSEHGKPLIISPNGNDFHFNISHSEDMWICATARCNIGIDIEKIKVGRKSIVEYYFTKEEQNYLAQSDNFDKSFFEIWTAKEAFAKFLGSGISATLLRQYTVSGEAILYEKNIEAYIHSGMLNEEYIYSIACNSEDITIELHSLT